MRLVYNPLLDVMENGMSPPGADATAHPYGMSIIVSGASNGTNVLNVNISYAIEYIPGPNIAMMMSLCLPDIGPATIACMQGIYQITKSVRAIGTVEIDRVIQGLMSLPPYYDAVINYFSNITFT